MSMRRIALCLGEVGGLWMRKFAEERRTDEAAARHRTVW
jgi:hypothetical protein